MKKIPNNLSGEAAELTRSSHKLSELRLASDAAWEAHKELIKSGHNKGLSLDQIASLTGVTKSRIWQIVTGRKK